ncbi:MULTISPECIES: STAS domain-containing protein [Thermomonospora]|uniref:Anti-sigma factor antagonist n=1 Tax=Thermomonospora cellulosilytica TaxID=1411118 RepID=A0A7W3N097_9ACTN|nr:MULTISPECIES: STAS domain-containing protein [Thermomonospora]MBA9005135.1 anti-sigma B factor antagonist [Thermomonospora cellulosilytica]
MAVPRCGRPAGRPQEAGEEPPDLTVTVTGPPGGTPVVHVAGEIDLHTAQLLRTRLIEIGRDLPAAGPARLVVDFADVAFCDATGLGALVGVHNDLRARGGELALARVRPAQRRLFQVTGLDRLFGLYATVAEAAGPRRTSFTG